MKLQYLGTAAAEAIPALFCDCEVCRRARELRGRHIRTRSQALLDGKLLIDYPCDSYSHFLTHHVDTSKIENILITHIHKDHFYPDDFRYIRPGYSRPAEGYKLRVYGSEDILEPMREAVECSNGQLEAIAVEPFVPFEVGEYTVTALKATHGTPHPYIYLIRKGKTSMLYAHDTDIFPEETIEYLSELSPRLSLVSFDCTSGAMQDNGQMHHHMCLARAAYLRDEMEYAGFLAPDSICVLNHFSHNGEKVSYDEFEEIAMGEGFLTSYDGMSVEF